MFIHLCEMCKDPILPKDDWVDKAEEDMKGEPKRCHLSCYQHRYKAAVAASV